MLTFTLGNFIGPYRKGKEVNKGSGVTLKVVYFGGKLSNI